ncbi:ECF transporter S component [Alkaliphilus sp. MSJ-5]|uniref:Riboflavin transporter n=1 Tax=Alkaliphilus flagellatus TaxID=2841507 RepID=A0ABS6G4U0_9FIRM|nr:ECF transporter S component [Alkaliphilus flagellatus]MBU5676712.1 ECF transporter S component [Alkaliphilus flagellatus]
MQKTTNTMSRSRSKLTTNSLVKISVLSVLSYILMMIEFPLPLFPSFLQFDFSDIPALLGAFTLGPVAGVLVQLVKALLHFLTKSQTGGVGELANFLVGISYIVPAALIYHRKKDRNHALIGLIAGTIMMTVVGVIVNLYITLPFYSAFMPMDTIVNLGTVVNSKIVDVTTLVLYGISPFNILKGAIIAFVTLLIYKKVSPILKNN